MNTPENVKLLKAHDEILSKASGKDGEVQYHGLVWTTNQPTEPGYYWMSWKPDWCFADEIVQVRFKRYRCQNTNELVVCPAGTEAQYGLGIAQKWAGPIPQPEDPE